MSLIAEYGYIFIILACCFGFFVAWGMGANDVSNAMATSVGSKALTMRQALIIAVIFEFTGAYLAGGEVTATISKGMIDANIISADLLVVGMLSSMLATGVWLLLASFNGWPVSTTHCIVGAIVGFAAVGIGVDAVQWSKVGAIASSWVFSPILSAAIAFILFRSVQKFILSADNPFESAQKYVPYYMFYAGFFVSLLVMLKGLKHIGLDLEAWESILLAILIAFIVAFFGKYLLSKVKSSGERRANRYADVERVFAVLMIFSACAMAFAHGSNDVSNAVGPLAAIVSTVETGHVMAQTTVPSWVLFLGACGLVIGLLTLGYKVMMTIGKKITELTPSRGFAAELAASSTVVLGSAIGMPLSTTHTLVGAILGVGLARGIGAIDLRVVGAIFTTWVVTLPAGALLSIMFFFMFKGMFAG